MLTIFQKPNILDDLCAHDGDGDGDGNASDSDVFFFLFGRTTLTKPKLNVQQEQFFTV